MEGNNKQCGPHSLPHNPLHVYWCSLTYGSMTVVVRASFTHITLHSMFILIKSLFLLEWEAHVI